MKLLIEKTSTDSRYSVDVSELIKGLVNTEDLELLAQTILESNLNISELIKVIDNNSKDLESKTDLIKIELLELNDSTIKKIEDINLTINNLNESLDNLIKVQEFDLLKTYTTDNFAEIKQSLIDLKSKLDLYTAKAIVEVEDFISLKDYITSSILELNNKINLIDNKKHLINALTLNGFINFGKPINFNQNPIIENTINTPGIGYFNGSVFRVCTEEGWKSLKFE